MMGTELRTCLVLFTLFLDQLGFNFMLGSYASCYTLGYGWLMMIQMLYLFLSHVHDGLMLLIKIICVNWNMENHPRKQYNHNYYMALVLAD